MAWQALYTMLASVCVMSMPLGRVADIVNSVTNSNPASFRVKSHLLQVNASLLTGKWLFIL